MKSRHTQLLDAIKELLDSAPPGTFSQSIRVVRRHMPRNKLEDGLIGAQVDLYPLESSGEVTDRDQSYDELLVAGALVRMKVSAAEPAEDSDCDTAAIVAEQVRNYLVTKTFELGSLGFCAVAEFTMQPNFDPEQLDTMSIYSSSLSFTYRLNVSA